MWLEVYEERGEEGAIIALIQLFLDRLKLSLVNNTHENDFEIPEHINLRTFNMDNFILALTANQVISIYSNSNTICMHLDDTSLDHFIGTELFPLDNLIIRIRNLLLTEINKRTRLI